MIIAYSYTFQLDNEAYDYHGFLKMTVLIRFSLFQNLSFLSTEPPVTKIQDLLRVD